MIAAVAVCLFEKDNSPTDEMSSCVLYSGRALSSLRRGTTDLLAWRGYGYRLKNVAQFMLLWDYFHHFLQ